MIRIDEVTTAGELDLLAPQWNDLLLASGRPSLYLTHEWLKSWWTCHASPDKRLCVLVARDDSGTIGLAPLVRLTRRYLGVSFRMVEFLSMARYADHPAAVSGSLDWIVCGREREVLGRFVEHLLSGERSWEALRLHPVPASSPLLPLVIEEARRRRCVARSRPVLENAVIPGGRTWEDFYRSLPGHFRREIGRSAHGLAALGSAEFRLIEADTDGVFFERMMQIERRSWKWTKGVSLDSAAYRGFYRRFAIAAARCGWLRLWMLSLSGEDIAYELSVMFNGELHCLKKSYDERYHRFFPGGLIEKHMYEAAFRAGVTQIHMLWGDSPHKRRWGSHCEICNEVLIVPPGRWKARALLMAGGAAAIHRPLAEYAKRIMRKAGVHPVFSELTRTDQL